MKKMRKGLALIGASVALGACHDTMVTQPVDDPPAATSEITVLPNAYNVLARVVAANVTGDSARVGYWSTTDTTWTPFFAIRDSAVRIPLLGMLAGTTYSAILQVRRVDTTTTTSVPEWTTGDLPAALRQMQLRVTGQPAKAYTLMLLPASHGGSASVVAVNGAGQIVWYRTTGVGGLVDAKQQPNGHFTAGLGPPGYIEFLPTGDSLRTWTVPAGFTNDGHELMLTGTDSASARAHLFGFDTRPVDKSPIGGPASATAGGHTLFRERLGGSVEFRWSAWDHFSIEDWIEEPDSLKQLASGESFDHPNAIDFDLDGNYIVSWRNFSAVTKIDYHTGQILWQLGGRKNQFTFVNDPLGGFNGQHSTHILPNGHLLLYDNGWRHDPAQTRVVEYALDLQNMTATMVWEYRHAPPIFTPFVGFVERHQDGNTFVAFGLDGIVDEVTPNDQVLWEGALTVGGVPTGIYRARAVPSLYDYREP